MSKLWARLEIVGRGKVRKQTTNNANGGRWAMAIWRRGEIGGDVGEVHGGLDSSECSPRVA